MLVKEATSDKRVANEDNSHTMLQLGDPFHLWFPATTQIWWICQLSHPNSNKQMTAKSYTWHDDYTISCTETLASNSNILKNFLSNYSDVDFYICKYVHEPIITIVMTVILIASWAPFPVIRALTILHYFCRNQTIEPPMNLPIYLDCLPETQVVPSLKGQISRESLYI